MKLERSAGLLLHPTSLPGPHGIGDLGQESVHWLDFLASSGVRVWQTLPLGPTGYADSPYQPFSSFAGNTALVNPDLLVQDGLLERADLAKAPRLSANKVDYGRVLPWKAALLDRAFERFEKAPPPGLAERFHAFWQAEARWLDDFVLFMALKDAHKGAPWTDWPAPLRARNPTALVEAQRRLEHSRIRHAFAQFLFARQWHALRDAARERGVRILGDIPIFAAHDSADVWASPELFELDAEGRPNVVAGVPPDYYSKTGQLWGNPLYRWDVIAARGFDWWIERVRVTITRFDLVRLDHFRGFVAFWEVPKNAHTAERGRWVRGPGEALFRALHHALGDAPLVVEDLGAITPDVNALRERLQVPGMRVLQFSFGARSDSLLPHRFSEQSVVYTSTHDNDTAEGWYKKARSAERGHFEHYRGPASPEGVAWDLIRMAWASVAALAITTPQDVLSLGSEARLNHPGRARGNWTWRLSPRALTTRLRDRLRTMNALYGRG